MSVIVKLPDEYEKIINEYSRINIVSREEAMKRMFSLFKLSMNMKAEGKCLAVAEQAGGKLITIAEITGL